MTTSNVFMPDQMAAHDFLTELRTRFTNQPLPYQYGVEARGLESLFEKFEQARESIKKYLGCEKFATAATNMLNDYLRPVTAKWLSINNHNLSPINIQKFSVIIIKELYSIFIIEFDGKCSMLIPFFSWQFLHVDQHRMG